MLSPLLDAGLNKIMIFAVEICKKINETPKTPLVLISRRAVRCSPRRLLYRPFLVLLVSKETVSSHDEYFVAHGRVLLLISLDETSATHETIESLMRRSLIFPNVP